MKPLRSGSCDVGFSTIGVIFGDEVEPGEARRRVAERLAAIQDGLPRGAVPVAAGPGWDPGQLPDGVAHANGLAATTKLVTRL